MGTAFLPAPFLEVMDDPQWVSAAVVAAVITLALPYFTTRAVLNIKTARLKASIGFALVSLAMSYLIVRSGLAVGEITSRVLWLIGAALAAGLLVRSVRLPRPAQVASLAAILIVAFIALQFIYDFTSNVTLAGDCREARVSDAVYKGKTSPDGALVCMTCPIRRVRFKCVFQLHAQ